MWLITGKGTSSIQLEEIEKWRKNLRLLMDIAKGDELPLIEPYYPLQALSHLLITSRPVPGPEAQRCVAIQPCRNTARV